MSIQKISVATTNSKHNVQKQKNQTKSVENFNFTNNNSLKNNFLNGISFKGFTKNESANRPHYMVGTSGSLMSVSVSDVHHPKNTRITLGEKGYNSQTQTSVQYDVYYADPDEIITDEIKKHHKFIVEYNEPEDITSEDIHNADNTSDLKPIVQTLKNNSVILHIKDEHITNKLKEIEQKKKDVSLKIQENDEKLNIAETKYKIIKKKEEDDYRNATLAHIKAEIEKINLSANEQIKLIEEERNARITELEEQKKELLGIK